MALLMKVGDKWILWGDWKTWLTAVCLTQRASALLPLLMFRFEAASWPPPPRSKPIIFHLLRRVQKVVTRICM